MLLLLVCCARPCPSWCGSRVLCVSVAPPPVCWCPFWRSHSCPPCLPPHTNISHLRTMWTVPCAVAPPPPLCGDHGRLCHTIRTKKWFLRHSPMHFRRRFPKWTDLCNGHGICVWGQTGAGSGSTSSLSTSNGGHVRTQFRIAVPPPQQHDRKWQCTNKPRNRGVKGAYVHNGSMTLISVRQQGPDRQYCDQPPQNGPISSTAPTAPPAR